MAPPSRRRLFPALVLLAGLAPPPAPAGPEDCAPSTAAALMGGGAPGPPPRPSPSAMMPRLDVGQYIRLLVSQRGRFPAFVRESMRQSSLIRKFEQQAALVDRLRADEGFNRLLGERGDLLTIKAKRRADGADAAPGPGPDPGFFRDWGRRLAEAVPDRGLLKVPGKRAAGSLLDAVADAFGRPGAQTNVGAAAWALAGTVRGGGPPAEVRAGLREGDLSALGAALGPGPEGDGRMRVLRGLVGEDRRLDDLLAAYALARSAPGYRPLGDVLLLEMDEGALERVAGVGARRDVPLEVAARLPGRRRVARAVRRRLGGMGRAARRRGGLSVRPADAGVITLVEVHPYLGILRGNLGCDCSTTQSFGFPNTPMERVFFLVNGKGEDVGYLNGTTVGLPGGKRGFLVKTVAGPRVSDAMAETAVSALSAARGRLGVDEIVLQGERVSMLGVNYGPILKAYERMRGESVWVSFPDGEIKHLVSRIVGGGRYDLPERLQDASRLGDGLPEVLVEVARRPFAAEVDPEALVARSLGREELFLVWHVSPDLAGRVGEVPDVGDVIGGARGRPHQFRWEGVLSNDLVERLGVEEHEGKVREVLRRFGAEDADPFELLGEEFLTGRLNAPDAFEGARGVETAAQVGTLLRRRAEPRFRFRNAVATKLIPGMAGRPDMFAAMGSRSVGRVIDIVLESLMVEEPISLSLFIESAGEFLTPGRSVEFLETAMHSSPDERVAMALFRRAGDALTPERAAGLFETDVMGGSLVGRTFVAALFERARPALSPERAANLFETDIIGAGLLDRKTVAPLFERAKGALPSEKAAKIEQWLGQGDEAQEL